MGVGQDERRTHFRGERGNHRTYVCAKLVGAQMSFRRCERAWKWCFGGDEVGATAFEMLKPETSCDGEYPR